MYKLATKQNQIFWALLKIVYVPFHNVDKIHILAYAYLAEINPI
jgi:hypothetical protein